MKTRVFVFLLAMLFGGWAFWGLAQRATAQGGPDIDTLKLHFWQAWADLDERLAQAAALESLPDHVQTPDAKTHPFGYASLMTFQSFLDGNWNIFLSNGNYEQLWRLTNDPNSDAAPRLNVDGDNVVFASNRYGNWDIFTRSVDGSNLKRLTTDGRDESYPAWSPDSRKIVYAKKTGDRYELYIMNADGSGQRVLSYPGSASDLDADWSPDGRQIAFVRRGDGGYGSLMVMDADGSHVRALASGLRYLQNPRWSPDGQQIGFDYDADNDDWNELAVIDVATGQIHAFLDFRQRFVDAWFGDWTGEGDHLIAVKAVYEVRDNRLYLKNTRLFLSRVSRGGWDMYEDSWVDLAPDWQFVDDQPPESAMKPLPRISPSYFDVSWSGQDVGIAGLAYFQVQKKEGNGSWEIWKERTTATHARFYAGGKAGKTFFFRVRAVDRAGNAEPWPATYQAKTTIETYPPIIAFDPIPPMLRKCGTISWQAEDVGGSGVVAYHFQQREVGTDDWQTPDDSKDASRRICETPGRTYEFRVRAKDAAGNWSDWIYSHPVTLYQWKIEGRSMDNRGRPLPVDVILSPPAFQTVSNPDDGRYAGYAADEAETYSVRWSSPGYQSLPTTSFPNYEDASFDVAFPPVDNVIPNWGFEDDNLESDWQVAGRAVITNTQRHTGRRSLLLGEPLRFEQEALWAGVGADLEVSPQGLVHLAFVGGAPGGGGYDLYYANRSPDGRWSSLRNVSHNPQDTILFQMQLDASRNRLHLAWGDTEWHYAARSADGTWSPIESIPLASHYSTLYSVSSFLDNQGNFYLAYPIWESEKPDLYLSIRSPAGVWKTETVAQDITSDRAYSLMVEPQGAVHAVWFHGGDNVSHMIYRYRDATGQWHESIQLDYSSLISGSKVSLIRDAAGALHVFWVCANSDASAYRFCHAQRDAQGAWGDAEVLLDLNKQGLRSWIVRSDHLNRIHLLLDTEKDLRYRLRRADGSWTPEMVVDPLLNGQDVQLFGMKMEVDNMGRAHILWDRNIINSGIAPQLFYTRQVADTRLLPPHWVAQGVYADLEVSGQGVAHVAATNPRGSNLLYAYNTLSPQDSVDSIERAVNIPADMMAPTLSFFYQGSESNRMTVQVGDQRFPLASEEEGAGWAHRWIDLTPWQGQTATIRFEVQQQAGELPAWVNLDEITLGSGAFPDLWVTAPSAAFPSQQPYTLTLAYGNASAEALAQNVTLTATLPADVRFIDASPPAQVQGDALAWSWPELPPGKRGEIRLTLQVDAPRAMRILPLRIASESHEPRQANNEARAALFADGYTQLLPRVAK